MVALSEVCRQVLSSRVHSDATSLSGGRYVYIAQVLTSAFSQVIATMHNGAFCVCLSCVCPESGVTDLGLG